MSSPIVLWIRREKEYFMNGKISGYAYHSKEAPAKKIIPRIKRIDQWNQYFSISYYDFRKGLQKISESLYSSLSVDRIVLWNDEKEFISLKDGTWIFPIDEDDWINPNTFSLVAKDLEIVKENLVLSDILIKTVKAYSYCNSPLCNICSFGYFIRTPCEFKTVAHHILPDYINNEIVYKYTGKKIGLKLENFSSLSFLQKNDLLKLLSLREYELNNFPIVKDYEEQMQEYKKLLEKMVI